MNHIQGTQLLQQRIKELNVELEQRDARLLEVNAELEHLEMTRIVTDDSAWKVLAGGMVIVFLTVLGTLWFKG